MLRLIPGYICSPSVEKIELKKESDVIGDILISHPSVKAKFFKSCDGISFFGT